ncbi:UNVERIFIED_CONTAM: Transposon TX1 uncharacterized protein [Sesamum radiatum]|uniref:Transposon TX1 uncharacterized protein n=1 Tax=Sesamum radiatum TaxID=300843 RepID=A0AAW2PNN1_SESRA
MNPLLLRFGFVSLFSRLIYFIKDTLHVLASLVGTPLKLDEPTLFQSRLNAARVCVEVDLANKLVEKIAIGIGEEEIVQEVIFENLPKYCMLCKHIGHEAQHCYTKGNAPKPQRFAHQQKGKAKIAPRQNARGAEHVENVIFEIGEPSNSKRKDNVAFPIGIESKNNFTVLSLEEAADNSGRGPENDLVGRNVNTETTGAATTSRQKESDIAETPRWENNDSTMGVQGEKHCNVEGENLEPDQIQNHGPIDASVKSKDTRYHADSLNFFMQNMPENDDLNAENDGRAIQSLQHAVANHESPAPLSPCLSQWAPLTIPPAPNPFDVLHYEDEIEGTGAENDVSEEVHSVRYQPCTLNQAKQARSGSDLYLDTESEFSHHDHETDEVEQISDQASEEVRSVSSASSLEDCLIRSKHKKPTQLERYRSLDCVSTSWQQPINGRGMFKLQQKLYRLKAALKKWNFEVFGNIFQNITKAEQNIKIAEQAYDANPSEANLIAMNRATAELTFALSVEECYWKQKAACRWLEEGEKNTKYFHSLVKKKKRKSRIYEIQHNGETLTEPEEIKASVVEHFEQAFSNDGNVILQNIHWVPSVLTQEDVQQLQENPTRENVKAVVFDMCADSTAGPDGFSAHFFQNCWDIIGSTPPKNFTTTTIVLIPKTETPSTWKDFRPISLCNVTGKILSKLINTQMAPLLPKIISPAQSGFVQGRLISDNILLAQELAHCLGKNGCMNNTIFKLDMEKAYDRVNWNFLYLMLCKVGFPTVWIDMIKKLIENCWFSILLNGEGVGFFKSTRGLRQGDPLANPLCYCGRMPFTRT